ncbi:MAG TPA: efflux transporter outer membrane subunit [Ramlibacter sp.]|nr:efflux transporter outer membrane subunit [Ramlibacter sp.]
MKNERARAGFQAGALVLALALAGCASPSGIASKAQPRDGASIGIAAGAQAPAVAAQWWKDYGDPALDQLVGQALAGSPALKVAQARLARAQAVTEVADAARLPQVTGSLDLTRQQYTANGAVPPSLAGAIRSSGTLQLGASWELDFFSKNQAALDAALGTARAAQADADAARVLLAGNAVRGYVQLARILDQLAVARRQLAQREAQLGLVRDRVRAGLDTALELRQSEGALPEARQQIAALQEQATLARNALAALAGAPPAFTAALAPTLADLRLPATAGVIPADLLGRRADIAAARWRVEAASRDLSSARAQFYPNINLVAFAGLSSIGLGRLVSGGSEQWGVGPAVRLPIFDAGRLRANLRGKASDLDAAVESYNGAIVDGVREVADQLASAQALASQQSLQREAQAAAEAAYQIALQRYQAGLGNYLNVLAAENGVLSQRRLGVDLAARALEAHAGLARALGGGWQGDAPAALASSSH